MRNRFFPIPVLFVLSLLIFPFIQARASTFEFVSSFGGAIKGAATYKNFLFLSQRDALIILDIQDKKHIRKLAEYSYHELAPPKSEDGDFGELAIKWPVLFHTSHRKFSYYHGVGAIDVSDIKHLRIIDTKFPDHKGGEECSWTIEGTRLFVATYKGYDVSYDISNPLNPVKLPTKVQEKHDWPKADTLDLTGIPPLPKDVFFSGSIQYVKAEGQRAYILDEQDHAYIVDVSDLNHPKYLGVADNTQEIRREQPDSSGDRKNPWPFKNKYQICSKDIEDGEGGTTHKLLLQDISNPKLPRTVKCFEEYMYGDSTRSTIKYWIAGNLLFFLNQTHNTGEGIVTLVVYDLSNPEKPECMFEHDLEEPPVSVTADGKIVYLAEGEKGLTILH